MVNELIKKCFSGMSRSHGYKTFFMLNILSVRLILLINVKILYIYLALNINFS